MTLTVLVIWQLVLDVVLLGAVAILLMRRKVVKPAPAPRPPAWHGELLELAQDLLAATDRIVDSLAARRAEPVAVAAPRADRAEARRDPWTMVRTGLAPEEAARRGGLLPAELRLLQSVAAAAVEPPTP
jgi:hypothetical protein